MKQFIISLIAVMVTLCAYAQKDVTKFLGIPIDGSKSEMIQKLKSKGFHSTSYNKDVLTGEFNGIDVNVFINTNGDKVCRIMVCDANTVNERSIQIRFNRLCRQFEQNSKYTTIIDNDLIPDDEDISYEISVNHKRYEAVFYQKPIEFSDSVLMRERLMPIVLNKYTLEELANPTDAIKEDVAKMSTKFVMELLEKKPVWFMISEISGKYYISMFYDNEENRANGEDL